jgi:hypothetical protein
VDQISPPFRIALLALLAVCALWFTVLKPKPPAAEPAPPAAPGATGLAGDVSAAKGAAAASDAANAKVQAATGGTQAQAASKSTANAGNGDATPRTAAKPKPKAATAAAGDRSAPLLSALDRKRAVVLLFWSKRGIDDRAVRRAVAQTADRDGRVVVKAVPVADVGRYESITRGAKVVESPTVLVIGPNRKARRIVGFTTTAEVDQAVGDALAAAKAAK